MAHTESQYAELQDAFALLQDIVTDEPLRDALLGFPERWLNAQSVLDKERLGGMVAFEIIFAILTAGIGTAANAAAKSKQLVKASETLQQASKLLRRKRLNTQSRVDLKPDGSASTPANLDTLEDTKKLELEDKPKVVPVRSMKQRKVACFKNKKGTKNAEYDRQLAGREAGINKMTVKEYLDNRKAFKAIG